MSWPCSNHQEPKTCITAQEIPTGRCKFCHEQVLALYGGALSVRPKHAARPAHPDTQIGRT